MLILVLLIIVLTIVLIFFMSIYNKIIRAKNRVRNAWAQIDVQLKKRFDLVPNLMNTVKGVSEYEKNTFKEIIDARNAYKSCNDVNEKIDLVNSSDRLFKSINVLHEAYPELKANEAYLKFMDSLNKIEEQISVSRMFYNDTVNNYNDLIMVFPNNVIASMSGFKESSLFSVNEDVRENVEVSF